MLVRCGGLNEQLDTLRQDASLGSVERAKAVGSLAGIALCCKYSLVLIQMLTAEGKFGGSGIESRRGYLTTFWRIRNTQFMGRTFRRS